MTTHQGDDATGLELIDELRNAWTADTLRAREILGELQAMVTARLAPKHAWARILRERLRREQQERESGEQPDA